MASDVKSSILAGLKADKTFSENFDIAANGNKLQFTSKLEAAPEPKSSASASARPPR